MTDAQFSLVVITDGRRECFERTMASASLNLRFHNFSQRLIVDDSADPSYWRTVDRVAEEHAFEVAHHVDRLGFGATVADGWARVAANAGYLFWLEDDFIFNQPVELSDMAEVLEANPHLAQMVLLRQPWNEEERAAGGIMGCYPMDYAECVDTRGRRWVEHRRFFSTNPSLYRAQLTRDHVWPDVPFSEGMFTQQLLKDPDQRFAFWGGRNDPPRVHHIGAERVGCGY